MKRLFLLRHAKAGFGTSDQTRPLASRGRKDAFWLGQYLKKDDLLPDHILCSSAARARETLSQVLHGAQEDISSTFHDDLYLASAEHMASRLLSLENDVTAVMVIGHNPGLSLLFQSLTNNPPPEDSDLKYPTCMLAVLDFDVDIWSELKSNMGQLFDLVIPSDKSKSDPNA